MTRVTLKYLKRLPNGKFQYRRAWPEDVRSARPDLPRERKKTFTSPDGSEREAIKIAQDLDREFETVKRQVRSGLAESAATWKTHENVRRWYTANKSEFEAVVTETPTTTPDGLPVIETTTAAEIIAENMLRDAARREGYGPDGHPKRLTLEEELKIKALASGDVPEPELTITDAYDIYLEKHLGGNEDKASRAAIDQFLEFMGKAATSVSAITRRTVFDWVDWLVEVRGQSSGTVRRRLTSMKAMINFIRKRDLYAGDNPFADIDPPKAARGPIKRKPFHRKHLDALETYLQGRRVRQETRDLVNLLLFTGCRPSEIGGLKAEDLQLDGDKPYMLVRWTDERRLKTAQSERRVPLIGPALEAARSSKERRVNGWLFPTIAPKSADRNDNQRLSARINKALRAAGIANSPRLVAYSFRHTMASALDQAPGVSQLLRDRVLGKRKPDLYGSEEPGLDALTVALEQAAPLLGMIDEVEYKPEELEISPRTPSDTPA